MPERDKFKANYTYLALALLNCGVDALTYTSTAKLPDYVNPNFVKLCKFTMPAYFFRTAAGINRNDWSGAKAVEAYANYYILVSHYDDAIDNAAITNTPTKSCLKNEQLAQLFLHRCLQVVRESPASPEMQKRFLHKFWEFRVRQYSMWSDFYTRFPSEPAPFWEVKKHKEETLELNARTSVDMFRLYAPNISDHIIHGIEKAVTAMSLYMQIGDDTEDLLIDNHSKTPNFLLSALAKHPKERDQVFRQMALCSKGYPIAKLSILAPASVTLCDSLRSEYLDMFSPGQEALREITKACGQIMYTKVKPVT